MEREDLIEIVPIALGVALYFAVPAIALHWRDLRAFTRCAMVSAALVLIAVIALAIDRLLFVDRPNLPVLGALVAAASILPIAFILARRQVDRLRARGAGGWRERGMKGIAWVLAGLVMLVPAAVLSGAVSLGISSVTSNTLSGAWDGLTELMQERPPAACRARTVPVRLSGAEVRLPQLSRLFVRGVEAQGLDTGGRPGNLHWIGNAGADRLRLCEVTANGTEPVAITGFHLSIQQGSWRKWSREALAEEIERGKGCDVASGSFAATLCATITEGEVLWRRLEIGNADHWAADEDWEHPHVLRRDFAAARDRSPWAFAAPNTADDGQVTRFATGYLQRAGFPASDLVGLCPLSAKDEVNCHGSFRSGALDVKWGFTAPADDPAGAFIRSHDAIMTMLVPLTSGE